MASENGTVMDVCAEWRDCLESADPSVWNDERIAGLVKTTKAQQLAYLARIEAAWKREEAEIEANALAVGGIVEAERNKPGNAAAMREALEAIRNLAYEVQDMNREGDVKTSMPPTWVIDIVSAALSAPPRQCDVGTAKEPYSRQKKWCESNCSLCDATVTCSECFCKWAQTPYAAQEGGAI